MLVKIYTWRLKVASSPSLSSLSVSPSSRMSANASLSPRFARRASARTRRAARAARRCPRSPPTPLATRSSLQRALLYTSAVTESATGASTSRASQKRTPATGKLFQSPTNPTPDLRDPWLFKLFLEGFQRGTCWREHLKESSEYLQESSEYIQKE
eukprot:9473335-Pyramimonas_sp.AAC.1